MNKFVCSAAALLLLAACAQTNLPVRNTWSPVADVGDFSGEGRLAVKVEQKGSYGNFDWSYQNKVQTINVNTPLGNTVGQLCQDRLGVLAVDAKGRVYEADTAEELSSMLLGYALPVQYLHIWAHGNRVADVPYRITEDGRLEQFGWRISRTSDGNGQVRTLLLEDDKLSVRLVFDEISYASDGSHEELCAARQKDKQ